jgi:metal-responsive CopG/Arc/MetJ family transcriptional regulator
MNTQKVAITIPSDLIILIDNISKKRGMSRSKFISTVLHEKILDERNRQIKEAYNKIFSDESICKEQLESASWFEGTDSDKGQEW